MEEYDLNLVAENTEIVLLTRQRIPPQLEMRVGTAAIAASNAVKYLGQMAANA